MITVDFDRLPLRAGHRILDVGCGSGRHTCRTSRFRGVAVVGTDINHGELTEARRRVWTEKEFGTYRAQRCQFVASDICSLPFRNEYFDLVICSEVLEHIIDASRAISELARVLKPGGNLVVSVPRYYPEKICWGLSKSYRNAGGGHVKVYRKRELKETIEKQGLCSWGPHFAHGLHTPYWWLKCLVGPENEESKLVNLYHDLLVWDIMKKPRLTRVLDSFLTPLLGKSLVMYFRKDNNVRS